MKRTIETAVEINASPQKVWGILSDTNDYPDWNPFIRSVDGPLEPGKTVTIILNPPDSGVFTFHPVVLTASFPENRWQGKFLLPGLFDGEHYFRVEPVSEQTARFIHGEHFSGLLVRLMGGPMEKTRRGFEMMNAALKKRAEE